MAKIWELDFYSRPILDENNKKVWEVLICETPTNIDDNIDSLFQYSKFCPNQTVNSIWLKDAINEAIEEAGEKPKKIRFFRRQMNNMIDKACEEIDIPAFPSRRTYRLNQWLNDRNTNFYPLQTGYDQKSNLVTSVQYPINNAIPLPDAIRGDKQDKWALVSLEADAFKDMKEWDISFGESFPLSMGNLDGNTKISGLILFSPRALPLAGWLSGLELCYLHLEKGEFPRICLETGVSDSWVLANITSVETKAEAEAFENRKKETNGIHFLAIQSSAESESFAGFWLLKENR